MDPKLEAFAYPTLDLKIARFIELHVNSNYNTITFTPERFKELTEYVGRKTLIRYYNLKPLQDADVIKFVWTNNDGRRVYMMNPAWSSQFNDADQEKYTDLYNRFVDGDGIGNIKIKYGIIDTKDELEDTEENEGEEESNKSNQEPDEPKGDSKTIVVHPEAEPVMKKENYNPVTDNPIDQATDFLVSIVTGVDKTRFGTWCNCKGGLMRYLEEKARLHSSGLDEVFPVYINKEHLDEIVDRFKRNL